MWAYDLIPAILFVCSSGLLFNKRFRENVVLVIVAGLIALLATYLMTKQLIDQAVISRIPVQASAGGFSSSQPPNDIVWPNAEAEKTQAYNCEDIACLTSIMEASGASPAAVDFAKKLANSTKSMVAWAIKAQKFDEVTLVYIDCAHCHHGEFAMVEGGDDPRIIPDATASDDLEKWRLAHYPNLLMTRAHGLLRHETTPSLGQLFIFVIYVAQCEACEPIAAVEYSFKFDGLGNFVQESVDGEIPLSDVHDVNWGLGH